MSYNAEVKGWIDFEVLIKNITVDIEKVMNEIANPPAMLGRIE